MEITAKELDEMLNIFKKDAGELIFVLRAHLFIEEILESIIKSKLPKYKAILEKPGLQFFDKLRLVRAMDVLPKGIFASINALNELRNKFAHNIDYKAAVEDIDKIAESFLKAYAKIKKTVGSKTKIIHPDGKTTHKNMILELTVDNLLGYMFRLKKDYV